jgi:hypothetical protein
MRLSPTVQPLESRSTAAPLHLLPGTLNSCSPGGSRTTVVHTSPSRQCMRGATSGSQLPSSAPLPTTFQESPNPARWRRLKVTWAQRTWARGWGWVRVVANHGRHRKAGRDGAARGGTGLWGRLWPLPGVPHRPTRRSARPPARRAPTRFSPHLRPGRGLGAVLVEGLLHTRVLDGAKHRALAGAHRHRGA